MGRRKHEYCSATSNDGLEALLQDPGSGRPSAGVAAAEKRISRREIKRAIRQNIRVVRRNRRGA